MNGEEFEEFKDKIYYYLSKYYDNPERIFSYKIDEEDDTAILTFNAKDLDWLCEESEEPEFWSDIRDNAKFSMDFAGSYYQLRIMLSFKKEEESEEAMAVRLSIEMMDNSVWDEIRGKVFRDGPYTTEKYMRELRDVLKKYFGVDIFWFYRDDDGNRYVAFYYKREMIILKFFSDSKKHTVQIADTKSRLIIESMEPMTYS